MDSGLTFIEELFQSNGFSMNVSSRRVVSLRVVNHEPEISLEAGPVFVKTVVELCAHGTQIHRVPDDLEVTGRISVNVGPRLSVTHGLLWGPITDRIHRLEEESGTLVRLQLLQGVSASTQVVHRHSRGLRFRYRLLLVLVLVRLLAFGGRDNKASFPLGDDGCLGGGFPVQTRGEQFDLRSGRSTRGGT